MIEAAEVMLARRQRIRMQRFAMALGTYGVFLLALAAIVQMGLGSLTPWRWTVVLAVCFAMNLGFWAAFRSGFNLRFADPSLTAPQIVASGWWGLIVLDALPEQHRTIPLMFFLGAAVFGILQLNTREFLRVVALLMSGYAAVLVYEARSGRADFHLGYQLFLFATYGLLLVWFSFLGGFVSSLKRHIRVRQSELEAASATNLQRANTDELTELFNRRHAMEALHRQTALAQRFGLPLSVGIVDIDHFKSVNDRFGHAMGDAVLREFSRWLRETLRDSDEVLAVPSDPSGGESEDRLVARIGGEEFLILLPGTDLNTATLCLERLRRGATVRVGSERISFSAGIASYRDGEPVESLLGRADRGLYEAKNAGRDQVRTVETSAEIPAK
jgi:GGDEF domain-containing protein